MCGKKGCNGGCSDCKKITAKTANCHDCDPSYTGNVLFDGPQFECEHDTNLKLTTDESLNDILQNIYSKLCTLSIPELYASQEIQEDFSINISPVTGVILTILVDGIYAIEAISNYQHATPVQSPLQICEGDISLIKNSVEVIFNGLKKTLISELNVASDENFAQTASLIHYISLVAGDTIALGIRSVNTNRRFTSLGGQISARKINNFVDQTGS